MEKKLFDIASNCTGCEACTNICPQRIIRMEADREGFFYPRIIDKDKCVRCNLCETVCPVKNIKRAPNFSEKAFAGYFVKQDKVLRSASGGLATAISETIINQGGIVYGVRYEGEDCKNIQYSRAVALDELDAFRGSKYAQSRKFDVYCSIKKDLDVGKIVLFIGCPCDVNALKLFLKNEYEKLYTCSLICHGPTSQKVHEQYIDILKKDNSCRINNMNVRFKKGVWKPYYIRVLFENGSEITEQFQTSIYDTCFQYMKRPSCNVCKLKRGYVNSDITIGDYHYGVMENSSDQGISSAMIHTERGDALISCVKDFYLESIPVQNAANNIAYGRAIPAYSNRREFGNVFAEKGIVAASNLKSCRKIEKQKKMKRVIITCLVKIKHFISSKWYLLLCGILFGGLVC